jgi:saccharopine dehydrogenase-like NADP-dependent oxidoreductase
VEQTVALIRKFQPDLVINVALPYQDLPSWMPASKPV